MFDAVFVDNKIEAVSEGWTDSRMSAGDNRWTWQQWQSINRWYLSTAEAA